MRHLLADERGDAMQWVMGLAVAALIIIALLTFGETLVDQIRGFLDSLSSSPLNDGGAGGDGGGG
jgi:Flp pilus assembly pilin Flp